jgi:xanthine dehydrogenase small subunit
MRTSIALSINGTIHEVTGKDVFLSLSDFLRENLNKKDTKVVCAEGDCGACTVLVKKMNQEQVLTVNSCISPLFALHNCEIVTANGVGTSSALHEVQKKMVEHQGSQCGFCTPGIVCSLVGMVEDAKLKKQSKIEEKAVRNHLTGNLCRCTGYQPIIEASVAIDLHRCTSVFAEPQSFEKKEVLVKTDGVELFMPTELDDALSYLDKNPAARIVAGATDLGVLTNKGKFEYTRVLSLSQIQSLSEVRGDALIEVGANVTLSQFERAVSDAYPEFKKYLHIFASPQIKNIATLVGNIANGSPIGDTIPALMVLDAEAELQSAHGVRNINLEDFYLGYKKFDIKPGELITRLRFRHPSANAIIKKKKVSQRKDLDISAVSLSMYLEKQGSKVIDFRLACGGLGPKVFRARNIEKLLIGGQLTQEFIDKLTDDFAGSIAPISDHRASAEYRKLVSKNLLKRFLVENLA